MTDPIEAAIRHASRDEHDGAAYTLDIQLAHGEWLRSVGVAEATSVSLGLSTMMSYRLVGDGDGADLFVNPALVAQVVVQW